MSKQKQKGTAWRLWSRVSIPDLDSCWEFQGYCHPTRGYGQMGRGSRKEGLVETHRLAYELTHGPIPAGMFVCHSCDNPPCVNPGHLWLGSPKDNARDMSLKGRARGARGTRSPFCKLSTDDVASIRDRYERNHERCSRGWRSNASELAAEYGVTKQYVGQLVRKQWRIHE